MMNGMTMAKVAITVPQRVLQRAKVAVSRGHAASLSAYVSDALTQKTMLDDLDALLVEMLAGSGGPLTARERAAADAALDGAPPRRRTK
jgi:hypothetical protein